MSWPKTQDGLKGRWQRSAWWSGFITASIFFLVLEGVRCWLIGGFSL